MLHTFAESHFIKTSPLETPPQYFSKTTLHKLPKMNLKSYMSSWANLKNHEKLNMTKPSLKSIGKFHEPSCPNAS